MKITNRQKKDLIRVISTIQYHLGQIVKNVDDSQSTASIGEILHNLSILTDAINDSGALEDYEGELWF